MQLIHRSGGAAWFAAAALVVAACDDSAPPTALEPTRVDQAWVVGEAAKALGALGQFLLPPPVQEPDEISAAQAVELATVWVRDFGPMNQGFFERFHRAAIDFASVKPCGRTLYAATPYDVVPAAAPPEIHNLFGPYWLVTFCSWAGIPQLSIGVAARTELTVSDGHLVFPRRAGNDFKPDAIPPAVSLPLSPERAAELAFEMTGRRIAHVPTLLEPGRGIYPQGARWNVQLESSVRLKTTSGRALLTDELYVGSNGVDDREAILVPAAVQPAVDTARFVTSLGGAVGALPVAVLPGRPLRFERIAGLAQ